MTFGFSTRVTVGLADDALAALPGEDAGREGNILRGHALKGSHAGAVLLQHDPHLLRQGVEFDASVKPLRVLPKDDHVDVVAEVEGVALERLAGPQIDVQVEHLPQAHDGAAVDQALALEL